MYTSCYCLYEVSWKARESGIIKLQKSMWFGWEKYTHLLYFVKIKVTQTQMMEILNLKKIRMRESFREKNIVVINRSNLKHHNTVYRAALNSNWMIDLVFMSKKRINNWPYNSTKKNLTMWWWRRRWYMHKLDKLIRHSDQLIP